MFYTIYYYLVSVAGEGEKWNYTSLFGYVDVFYLIQIAISIIIGHFLRLPQHYLDTRLYHIKIRRFIFLSYVLFINLCSIT